MGETPPPSVRTIIDEAMGKPVSLERAAWNFELGQRALLFLAQKKKGDYAATMSAYRALHEITPEQLLSMPWGKLPGIEATPLAHQQLSAEAAREIRVLRLMIERIGREVNVTREEMQRLLTTTRRVVEGERLPQPSHYAANGVYRVIIAAVQAALSRLGFGEDHPLHLVPSGLENDNDACSAYVQQDMRVMQNLNTYGQRLLQALDLEDDIARHDAQGAVEQLAESVAKVLMGLLQQTMTHRHGPMRRETGRNDPCPCGSGKKFKKCCLRADDWRHN